jgi:hypothetical protein
MKQSLKVALIVIVSLIVAIGILVVLAYLSKYIA